MLLKSEKIQCLCCSAAVAKLFFVFLLLFAAACAGSKIAPPALAGKEISSTESQRLFHSLKKRSQEIETFRSIARASLEYGKERGRLRYAFVFAYPDRLRIEALPVNGLYTLNLLVARKDQAVFVDPAEKRAFVSSKAEHLLEKGFRLDVTKQELMSLLLGRIDSQILNGDGLRVVVDPAGNYVVGLESAGWFWHVDPRSLCVRRAESWQKHQQRLIVVYGPCTGENDFKIPQSLVLLLPQDDVTMSFEQQHMAVNQKLPDELFKAAIPGDYQIEWISR
jgi:outer membrane lipoprotein-sorting protein